MNRLFAFGFASLASYMIFLGCGEALDSLGNPDFIPDDPCSGGHQLSGNWQITGEGERDSCRDEFLNTDRFSLGSVSLLLTHTEAENTLELTDPSVPASFEFRSGEVDGICVKFTTAEVVGSQTIEYRWTGKAKNSTLIEGTFRSTGPSGCVASGSFEMNRD